MREDLNTRDKKLIVYESKEILRLIIKIEDIKEQMFHEFSPHLADEHNRLMNLVSNSSVPLQERRKAASMFRRRLLPVLEKLEKKKDFKISQKRREHGNFLKSIFI